MFVRMKVGMPKLLGAWCGEFELYGLQLELVTRGKLGYEMGTNFERRFLLIGVL